MAENEILDVARSRLWRRTRSLLVSDASPADVSICIAEELDQGVVKVLSSLHRGETLLTLLKALQGDLFSSRIAVDSFKNKELIRIARMAIATSGHHDPARLASAIVQCITDRVYDQIMHAALQSEKYHAGADRDALKKAISEKIEGVHGKLSHSVEASLRGEKIKPYKKKSSENNKEQNIAEVVASTSLIKQIRPRPHGI